MKFLANSKVIAYIFYVLAILFGIYTIVAMVVAIQTIMYTVTSGMYGSVPFSEMLTYFFTQAGPFLFYSLALFFFGYAIQLLAGEVKPKEEAKKEETSTSVEPASSYSGTLDNESNLDTTSGIDDIVLTTANDTDDLADSVEEDVVADDKPVVDGLDEVEVEEDDIPVIEDDADLTKEKLDDLEEGIVDFDKKEEQEGEGIDDTML